MRWGSRVFKVEGRKLHGSGVLIDGRNVLTAAHLSFKVGELYTIRGKGDRVFQVTCKFICKRYDFSILESKDLPEVELPTATLREEERYFIMVRFI